jgi:hypothetical protein
MVESLIGKCGYSEVETRGVIRRGPLIQPRPKGALRAMEKRTCQDRVSDRQVFLVHYAEALYQGGDDAQSTESGDNPGARSGSRVLGVLGGGGRIFGVLIVVAAASLGGRGRGGGGLGAVLVVVVVVVATASNVGVGHIESTAKSVDVVLAALLTIGIVGVLLNALAEESLADEGGHGDFVVLETGSRFVGGAKTLVAQIGLRFC